MAHQKKTNNALRRLGITAQALCAEAFGPTKTGFIKKNEYEMFWSQVSTNPPEATVFLDEVLKRLFSSLEKASPEVGVSLESLVNTISFICLTLEFIPTDPKIKRFLENWQKQEAVKDLSRTFPPAKEVVRTLSLRVENQDMIGPLIIGCSTLHSVKEFQRLADVVSFPTLDESDIKSGESCFLYDHLRSLATHKEHLANILQSTRNKMLTLPQQMKMNPKVAETTLCALLHMLKQFMSIAAVTDVQFLKSMSTIQQFYLWPCPYGNLTRDLLLLLQAETLCPGSLLRQRLIREAYVADYLDEKGVSSALFYVVDGTDRGSMAYVNSMDIRPYKPTPSRRKNDRNVDEASLLSTTTQAMIVLNMLHTDVGVHDDELRYFRALTPQNVAQLYQKTAQIMNEVNQRPDQAREIRIRGLTTIRDSLKTLATASGRAGQTIKLPEKLVDPFTPSMPPVAHLHILTKVAYDTTTKQSDLLNGETPYVLATPMVDDLRALLSSYCNKSDKPITIRIVIAGGDELVHTFLCAYMSIRQSKPELLDGIQLRFFIAPLAKNHIAAFLARHDSWYNRHVYVPFRSPVFILPWISSDEATSQSDEKQVEIAPPGLFFRSTLESYAREAEVVCELNVYKVEGWLYATSGKKDVHADQVIPFVQRVEIGIAPATQRYRESRKVVGEIKVDDMIKDKYFEFNPPEVVVKFTKMDLSGRVQETITEEGGVYWGLLCANVPRRGDACFPPDPTSPWLEFHAKLHKNFRRETTRKNVLATDPRQHIIDAEISCLLPTQNFSVLIDGQTFGPFHKIKISAAADDKANKRIKFPVQTFFPLDM